MNIDALQLNESAYYLASLPPEGDMGALFEVITAADARRLKDSPHASYWTLEPTDLDMATAYYCIECGDLEANDSNFQRLKHRLMVIMSKEVGELLLDGMINAYPVEFQTGRLFSMPSADLASLALSMLAQRASGRIADQVTAPVVATQNVKTTRRDSPQVIELFPQKDQDDDAGGAVTARMPDGPKGGGDGNGLSIPDVMKMFVDDRRSSNLRGTTIRTYSYALHRLRDYCQEAGITKPDELTPQVLKAYIGKRLDAGISATTMRTERGIAVAFCTFLSDNGYCSEYDWNKKVKGLRTDSKEPLCLTAEQCGELLYALEHLFPGRIPLVHARDVALVSFLLDTALRASECLRLTPDDIDLEQCEVKVSGESKSRKPRLVWFGETTRDRLRAYLAMREPVAKVDKMWVTKSGKSLSYMGLYELVATAARSIGLKGCGVHTLRHAAASILTNGGHSLEDVRQVLGHSKLEITQKYLHVRTEDVRKRLKGRCPIDMVEDEE